MNDSLGNAQPQLYHVGERIELHPATDAWARGDRYGSITKATAKYYHISMDRSGRILRVPQRNILHSI